ncbi:MAG: hypothetical protein IPO53_08680 [Chitinophagaceae bacterium]|nr:hypothetical protein [Chitinophagaceae bacterium]
MTWNSIMGFVSSFALFLPIIFILAFHFGRYSSFPVLLFYYSIVLVYNLMTEGYIKVNPDVVYYWGLSNNLLDVPLMLTFLTYFTTSAEFTRRLKITIGVFLLFEAILIFIRGFNVNTLTIILGPGLLIVFGICLFLFIRQTKITILHRKASGKALIATSLLFAYGCYAIIYLIYYVFKTPHVADTFLLYFWVVTFSSLLMCAGIIFERKRVLKLYEVKNTRKELSVIYKDTKKAAPVRAAMLDFDKEHWN